MKVKLNMRIKSKSENKKMEVKNNKIKKIRK